MKIKIYFIGKLYIRDILEKDDPNWRMKKYKRLKFTKKLDDLKTLRNELIQAQKRIEEMISLHNGSLFLAITVVKQQLAQH